MQFELAVAPALAAPAGAPGGRKRTDPDRAAKGADGVIAPPASFGRSFESVDEYLERPGNYAGPIDLPWRREIRT